MSDVIDLDFYRKFRVILPIPSQGKNQRDGTSRTKVYRRRRKVNPKVSSKTNNTTPS